jgi:hypothetical protein
VTADRLPRSRRTEGRVEARGYAGPLPQGEQMSAVILRGAGTMPSGPLALLHGEGCSRASARPASAAISGRKHIGRNHPASMPGQHHPESPPMTGRYLLYTRCH